MGNENLETDPVAQFEVEIKQFQNWVAKQCFPIELALSTISSAVAGAYTGISLDAFFEAGCSLLSVQTPSKGCELDPEKLSCFGGYQPLVQSFGAGPAWEQARNFAVMYAASAGMSCVMKKLRGKIDVQSSLATGFGTGVMISLATGMRGPEVVSVGVMFALVNGGLCKVEEKLAQQKAEDALHDKPGDMFSSIGLGLNHDMMNFNTGFFTDNTLSLLNRKKAKKGGKTT